jgi:hypothetical protein
VVVKVPVVPPVIEPDAVDNGEPPWREGLEEGESEDAAAPDVLASIPAAFLGRP